MHSSGSSNTVSSGALCTRCNSEPLNHLQLTKANALVANAVMQQVIVHDVSILIFWRRVRCSEAHVIRASRLMTRVGLWCELFSRWGWNDLKGFTTTFYRQPRFRPLNDWKKTPLRSENCVPGLKNRETREGHSWRDGQHREEVSNRPTQRRRVGAHESTEVLPYDFAF